MSRAAPASAPRIGGAPLGLVLPAGLALAVLVLPLLGLLLSTSWAGLGDHLRDPVLGQALWLSVLTATVATVLALVLGLPLAWCLARTDFTGRSVVRALVAVPMVLPPVVGGVALLSTFGRMGFIGAPLRTITDWSLPFTTAGVVVAHVFVALPFVVLSLEGALRSADPALDTVAATLGASRWHIFRTVSVPLVLPGLAAAALLGWARSMGEFGATITFAGSYPGTTQTMPTLIQQMLNSDPDLARTASVILLGLSVLVLLLLREKWWILR